LHEDEGLRERLAEESVHRAQDFEWTVLSARCCQLVAATVSSAST
jgi:hypothetical protein